MHLKPDLASVYADLSRMLAPYAAILDTKRDDESELYVATPRCAV